MTKVSVILTVLNEVQTLPELLASLEQQSRTPDQVVVVDGGSSDGTRQLLANYRGPLPVRALEVPGCTIAQGRNAAIRAASGDIIAVTDAGVRLCPLWLEALTRPIERETAALAVAGFFHPDPRSWFEAALGATVLPAEREVRPEAFLPSSRSVAFTKSLWEQVGGYPEWLDYCEDLVFDLRIRKLGVRFSWAPQALAYFRPRPSLGSFFLQYYRYARGDGKAALWTKRHLVRYGTYACLLAALPIGVPPLMYGIVFLGGGSLYCYSPYRRLLGLLQGLSVRERLAAFVVVPLIRLTGDVAKMLGYPVGVWWRLTQTSATGHSPRPKD